MDSETRLVSALAASHLIRRGYTTSDWCGVTVKRTNRPQPRTQMLIAERTRVATEEIQSNPRPHPMWCSNRGVNYSRTLLLCSYFLNSGNRCKHHFGSILRRDLQTEDPKTKASKKQYLTQEQIRSQEVQGLGIKTWKRDSFNVMLSLLFSIISRPRSDSLQGNGILGRNSICILSGTVAKESSRAQIPLTVGRGWVTAAASYFLVPQQLWRGALAQHRVGDGPGAVLPDTVHPLLSIQSCQTGVSLKEPREDVRWMGIAFDVRRLLPPKGEFFLPWRRQSSKRIF